jgi:hypothetical protein
MKKIHYPRWIFFLSLMITLVPGQQLSAAIKQFTDEKGTIHIDNNTEDNNKLVNKDSTPPAPQSPREVVKPPAPTPPNISPKAEAANDEDEEPKTPDDDD